MDDKKAKAFLSLICFPTTTTTSERLLKWTIRESSGHDMHMKMFDDDQRIEIVQTGLYRIQVYLEPVDNDCSKYYLEVNGNPLPGLRVAYAELWNPKKDLEATSASFVSTQGEHLPLKHASVVQLRLNKWDMVVVRRKGNWAGQYGGRSPFGRLIFQVL